MVTQDPLGPIAETALQSRFLLVVVNVESFTNCLRVKPQPIRKHSLSTAQLEQQRIVVACLCLPRQIS